MKKAFTLIETLVSLLIISAVSIASMMFVSSYMKSTHDMDVQSTAAIENLTILEEIKAGAETLSLLYSLTHDKDVKITAIGIGEISLEADGSYTVIAPEPYGFVGQLQTDKPSLLRIDIGGDIPNTRMTTVVMIR